jgi:hypothetical protein
MIEGVDDRPPRHLGNGWAMRRRVEHHAFGEMAGGVFGHLSERLCSPHQQRQAKQQCSKAKQILKILNFAMLAAEVWTMARRDWHFVKISCVCVCHP